MKRDNSMKRLKYMVFACVCAIVAGIAGVSGLQARVKATAEAVTSVGAGDTVSIMMDGHCLAADNNGAITTVERTKITENALWRTEENPELVGGVEYRRYQNVGTKQWLRASEAGLSLVEITEGNNPSGTFTHNWNGSDDYLTTGTATAAIVWSNNSVTKYITYADNGWTLSDKEATLTFEQWKKKTIRQVTFDVVPNIEASKVEWRDPHNDPYTETGYYFFPYAEWKTGTPTNDNNEGYTAKVASLNLVWGYEEQVAAYTIANSVLTVSEGYTCAAATTPQRISTGETPTILTKENLTENGVSFAFHWGYKANPNDLTHSLMPSAQEAATNTIYHRLNEFLPKDQSADLKLSGLTDVKNYTETEARNMMRYIYDATDSPLTFEVRPDGIGPHNIVAYDPVKKYTDPSKWYRYIDTLTVTAQGKEIEAVPQKVVLGRQEWNAWTECVATAYVTLHGSGNYTLNGTTQPVEGALSIDEPFLMLGASSRSLSGAVFPFDEKGGTLQLSIDQLLSYTGIGLFTASERSQVLRYVRNNASEKDIKPTADSDNGVIYTIGVSDDASSWVSVERNAAMIDVHVSEFSQTHRVATLTLTIQYPWRTQQGRYSQLESTFTLDQTNSGTKLYSVFQPYRGKGYETFADGRQQVHTFDTTIYYNPAGADIPLSLKDRGFNGYMRWYDYNTGRDPQYYTKEDGSIGELPDFWKQIPYGRLNYGANKETHPFHAINTDPEQSKGWYFLPSKSGDYKEVDTNRGGGLLLFPAPIVHIEQAIDMDIACDVSNYSDYVLKMVGDRLDTLREPTLSYRQIFHLRPPKNDPEEPVEDDAFKKKMSDALKQCILSNDLTDTKDATGDSYYYETHIIEVPVGTEVNLSADYELVRSKGATTTKLHYWLDVDGKGTYLRTADQNKGNHWPFWYYLETDAKGNRYWKYLQYNTTAAWSARVDKRTDYYESNDYQRVKWDKDTTMVWAVRIDNSTRGKTFSAYNGQTLGLVRWTVTWSSKLSPTTRDTTVFGPSAKPLITKEEITRNYVLLSEQNFDFNAPNTTAYTLYPKPLSATESTYGFVYPHSVMGINNIQRRNEKAAESFAYYGEYAIVNKVGTDSENGKSWLLPVTQHTGDATNGYCLYVDGAQILGKVVSLSTDAKLCPGQQMYCSMWLCNPAKDSQKTKPNFYVVVEGRTVGIGTEAYAEWEKVEAFQVGELPSGGVWKQIKFPLISGKNYDETRITLYNFAADNEGNDFLVDDVWLYASRLPFEAFQTSTQCWEGEEKNHVATLVRMDYSRFLKEEAENTPELYYHIYDSTDHKAVRSNYYNVVEESDSLYGYVDIPKIDYIPSKEKGDSVYNSLSELMEAVSNRKNGNDTTYIAYMPITEDGKTRYLMYIVQLVSVSNFNQKHDYVVRAAYRVEALSQADCTLSTNLPVYEPTSFVFNGETYPAKGQCANERYPLDILVRGEIYDGDRNVSLSALARGEWLVGFDFDDIYYDAYLEGKKVPTDKEKMAEADKKYKEKYGYSRVDVENAIADMRRDPASFEKTNYDITDYHKLHSESEYWHNPDDYQIIKTLCEKGFLRLALTSEYLYMHADETVRYWVFPTAKTAKVMYTYQDTGEEKEIILNQCASPTFLKVFTNPSEHKLHLGVDATKLQQGQLPRIRLTQTEANNGFDIPIKKIGTDVVIGWDSTQIDMNGTTDPLILDKMTKSANFSMRYAQDKVYTDDPVHYYTDGSNIRFTPINQAHVDAMKKLYEAHPDYGEGHPGYWRVNTDTMRAGYEYTIRVQMVTRSNFSADDAANAGCQVGYSYITLVIVPDTLVWTPSNQTDGFYHWGDDANWRGLVNGKVSDVGFAPLASSMAIIPDGLSPEKYPYIAKEDDLYPTDANYHSATCKKVQFRWGARALGQENLSYEKAFVDMQMQSTYWNTVAAPLQDMYSGDFFIPHTGTYINGTNLEPLKAAGDYAQDFTVSGFSGTRTASAAYAFWASYYNQNVTTVTATHEGTIDSETLTFVESNGMDECITPGRGVSVAGWGPGDGVEQLEIRLPKTDGTYTYFAPDGKPAYTTSVSRTNSDKLAFTPEADGTMTVTIDKKAGSGLFLFGNPTMAYMDVFALLDANSDVLQQESFRYQKDGAWHTVSRSVSADGFIAPMQSVMLKAKDESATRVTVKVSRACLALTTVAKASTDTKAPQRANGHTLNRQIMNIVAYTPDNRAFATLAAIDFADNGYNNAEDVVFISSGVEVANSGNGSVSPINIYTMAGTQPLSVDIREQIGIVPLGFVIGDDYRTDSLTLYFGLNLAWEQECYLCDSKTGMRRRICNDSRIRIATPQNHEMRYYIEGPYKTPNTPTDGTPAKVDTDGQHVRAFSANRGMISVAASGNIADVRLYDVAGRLLQEETPAHLTPVLTLHSPSGLVIVDVRLTTGLTYRTKVMVQ